MEINITPNGISIKTQKTQTLYDGEGNPIEVPVVPAHRVAVGIGDFAADVQNPTAQEKLAFQAKIDDVMGQSFGQGLAATLVDMETAQAQYRAASAGNPNE